VLPTYQWSSEAGLQSTQYEDVVLVVRELVSVVVENPFTPPPQTQQATLAVMP